MVTYLYNMVTFGEWLKLQIKSRNLTQKELAERSGITPAQISRIINGTRGAGENALVSIARVLHISPEAVFRAAEIFPPKTEKDATTEEAEYIISNYRYPETRQQALEYLKFLQIQEDQPEYRAGKTKEHKESLKKALGV